MEAHSPDDCLSIGKRPVPNEALMCIIYLFKWSVPALHPVPFLRSFATTKVKGLVCYLLSGHLVKTFSSPMAVLKLEQDRELLMQNELLRSEERRGF